MKKIFSVITLIAFFAAGSLGPVPSYAQQGAVLPKPGEMVSLSQPFSPLILAGMKVYPENPFVFDFILDSGDTGMNKDNAQLRQESDRLIKYFLATLTVPEDNLWVNLSPYENDRIIPEGLGQTDMGRDMLAQDYILKQLTASLIYPEKDLGKIFWDKVYARAKALYKTTEIPVDTFNKVWILPEKAKVYVHKNTAFVVASRLKVMLDIDYTAWKENASVTTAGLSLDRVSSEKESKNISASILREIIVPEIENEVNSGKNFATLRQIYSSMILATWYKKSLKKSLLTQVYADKGKVAGIDLKDKTVNERIYRQYVEAYRKGVFDYIKEDIDRVTREPIPRKYFSGGVNGLKALGLDETGSLQDEDVSRSFGNVRPGRLLMERAVIRGARHQSAMMSPAQAQDEVRQARTVAAALHTVLDLQSAHAPKFLQGKFGQAGYGVASGAVNDGSHAIGAEGDQGYYVDKTNIPDGKGGFLSGKDIFVNTVNGMKDLFKRRHPKVVIKIGIGGQHTPFQGIADVFQVIDPVSGRVTGEYELGKNWEEHIQALLDKQGAGWDQVAFIPSSKSGETDETMKIFDEIFQIMLEKVANMKGLDGKNLARSVIAYLHQINFDEKGEELPGDKLFSKFSIDDLVVKINAEGAAVTVQSLEDVLGAVLGNMFFETTDRPADSRLSAFIRNARLDELLGKDNIPGFGAMFDNVGGRWTGDLHMMTFLAFHDLDPEEYWKARRQGIQDVREGHHEANILGHAVLDKEIKKIAFVVPDELFWFGKATEQNFNESIWQKGFANLRAIKLSDWEAQQENYTDLESMVINLSSTQIDGQRFQVENVAPVNMTSGKQVLAQEFARLFTTFYGMTYTVGTRLIARALTAENLDADQLDINDLDNPATKILQKNLYLRQPFVELGKKLLKDYFDGVQSRQEAWDGQGTSPLEAVTDDVLADAAGSKILTNIPELPQASLDAQQLAGFISQALQAARQEGRTFVPFIYLEGKKFTDLREKLVSLGIEWVLQGTGDQHISYQQVLANPDRFLPFFISFVPPKGDMRTGIPAIGFSKGYLSGISPNLIRHFFAKFSYEALLSQGGKGVFVTMLDTPAQNEKVLKAFSDAVNPAMTSQMLFQAWAEGKKSLNRMAAEFKKHGFQGIILRKDFDGPQSRYREFSDNLDDPQAVGPIVGRTNVPVEHDWIVFELHKNIEHSRSDCYLFWKETPLGFEYMAFDFGAGVVDAQGRPVDNIGEVLRGHSRAQDPEDRGTALSLEMAIRASVLRVLSVNGGVVHKAEKLFGRIVPHATVWGRHFLEDPAAAESIPLTDLGIQDTGVSGFAVHGFFPFEKTRDRMEFSPFSKDDVLGTLKPVVNQERAVTSGQQKASRLTKKDYGRPVTVTTLGIAGPRERYDGIFTYKHEDRVTIRTEHQAAAIPVYMIDEFSFNDEASPAKGPKPENSGGMDFTTNDEILESSEDVVGFRMDPKALEELKSVAGFLPVVIRIQPIKDFSLLMGLGEKQPPFSR